MSKNSPKKLELPANVKAVDFQNKAAKSNRPGSKFYLTELPEKMERKEYDKFKIGLQIELLKMQNWVRQTGEKVVIIFLGVYISYSVLSIKTNRVLGNTIT